MSDPISRCAAAIAAEKERWLRDYCSGARAAEHESPIEAMLAGALEACQGTSAVQVLTAFDSKWNLPHFTAPTGNEPKIYVFPQAAVGPYRVDLLILASGYESSSWHHLVVECDGHDFHERTKEQAARDRSRDRYMQEQGLTVFRFTGHELHADLYRCAKQVLGWADARFSADLQKQIERHRP